MTEGMPAARRAFLSDAPEQSIMNKPDRPADPVPAVPPVPGKADPIPPEWNSQSTKEFTVPPGGTDQAKFDIVTSQAR